MFRCGTIFSMCISLLLASELAVTLPHRHRHRRVPQAASILQILMQPLGSAPVTQCQDPCTLLVNAIKTASNIIGICTPAIQITTTTCYNCEVGAGVALSSLQSTAMVFVPQCRIANLKVNPITLQALASTGTPLVTGTPLATRTPSAIGTSVPPTLPSIPQILREPLGNGPVAQCKSTCSLFVSTVNSATNIHGVCVPSLQTSTTVCYRCEAMAGVSPTVLQSAANAYVANCKAANLPINAIQIVPPPSHGGTVRQHTSLNVRTFAFVVACVFTLFPGIFLS